MNRNTLIVLGVAGLAAYFLWTRLSPALAPRPAVAGGTTPINSARITTRSGQLQNQLLQIGAGWAANELGNGDPLPALVTGENGGGDIPSESTAPSSPATSPTTASTSN